CTAWVEHAEHQRQRKRKRSPTVKRSCVGGVRRASKNTEKEQVTKGQSRKKPPRRKWLQDKKAIFHRQNPQDFIPILPGFVRFESDSVKNRGTFF
ncbi:hypothetical protein, partial [Ruminococcus champanellensis]|uniref:hypothetical protein n=1 Tax=Ruminococcus champanellensis TaxID=1161942 RepID=UPI001A9812D0